MHALIYTWAWDVIVVALYTPIMYIKIHVQWRHSYAIQCVTSALCDVSYTSVYTICKTISCYNCHTDALDHK